MLKKYLLYILIALILAPLVNLGYEAILSPGNKFFSECIEVTGKWEKNIRKTGMPCYVFAGGSEVRMGIEPTVMLKEQGLPAINAGVQAGNGIRCNAQIGLKFLKKGDTLVLSVFPKEIQMGRGTTRSGINFCVLHLGKECFFANKGILSLDFSLLSNLFFGSSSELSVYIMRILTRPNCIYRYSCAQNARIAESGRVEVFIRNNHPIKHVSAEKTSHKVHGRGIVSLIRDVREACRERGAELVAYIPRRCISATHKSENAVLALCLTDLGVPVLRDPQLGTWEDSDAFSDTTEHLSIEGGREFSVYIAKLLKEKDYWTREELLRTIYQP